MTTIQLEVLKYVADTIQLSGGVCPSYDEIKKHMGFASKSGVDRVIGHLVRDGYIAKLPNRARSLEVLRLPAAPVDAVWAERERCAKIVEILLLRVMGGHCSRGVIESHIRQGTKIADVEKML